MKALGAAQSLDEMGAILTTLSQGLADAVSRFDQLRETPIAPPPPPPPAPVPSSEAQYVDTKGASKLLGLSVPTLEGMRARGVGPNVVRVGRRIVRYHVPDLHAWAAAQKRPL